MGMYDFVRVPAALCKCSSCGGTLKNWQSKDRECQLGEVQWWEVDNFYTHCDNCGNWVEYFRKEPSPIPDALVLSYFKLV